MILSFDTETDGIPQKNLDPLHPNQVHLVELGCVLMEEDGTERCVSSLIVRPDGWVIPEGAHKVHGIRNEVAARCGVSVGHVLNHFCHLLELADLVIAYNVQFDKDVMSIELIRHGEPRPVEWPDVPLLCICDAATPVVNAPPTERMKRAGRMGPKRPKLTEAYLHLFGEELVGAHSALADARACARVYNRLRADGAI